MAPRSPRILVVDDDPLVVRSLEGIFRYEGYEVATTTRGMEALDLARRERFDVILLDLVMPDVDGLTVLRYARAFAPDTCAIVLSGHLNPDWEAAILRQGAAAVFSKPPVMAQLLRFLEAHRRERPLRVAS